MALTKPFAEQGEKKAISLTPDAEGTMNYQDGFGQRYSLPVKSTISEDGTITTTGGLWIQREQFNQLMFDATSAIIENQDNITQLNQDLGNKDDLTTTNKDNIVSAINELDSNIGDLQDLTTTEKSNVVSAINEIDSNYVRLDTEQTIPSVKTFSNVVNFGSIVNVNGEANFNNNVEMVNTPTITSPKTFQDLIDNELITKAQSVSKFVDFDTNQSVSGLKTFTTLPQSEATPTDDKDLTTKLYVDTTLSDKIAEIGKAMGFKGIVENATDLPTDTATDGDMYYNKATSGETEDNKKGFYVFNGTAFDFIGATISMDFDKIFEIEDKQGDLTQLKTTAKDNLVNAINENYDSIETNSQHIADNEGAISTINNNIGDLNDLTTTAKTSVVNAINEIDNSLKNNNFVTLDTEQTITSLKTFDKLPQSSATPANDTDFTNKAYVDSVAGGGGSGNYLPLNVDTDTEVTTTAGSNAQLSLNFTDSTVAQGATYEISNQEHNIQFSKDAGINNIKLNQNLEFKLDSNINAGVVADLYTMQKFGEAFNIPPYAVMRWDMDNYTDLAPKYVMIGNYTMGSAALVVGDYWTKSDGSGEAIATAALVANDTARMQAGTQSQITIGNEYNWWNGIFLQETTTQIMMYGTNETDLKDDITLNWYIRGQKNDSITMQNSKGFIGLGDNLTISGIGKYAGNYSVFSANNSILIGSAPFKNDYSLGGIDKQNNTYTMVDKATLGEEYLDNGHIIVSEFDISIGSKDSIDMKTGTINAIGDIITIGDNDLTDNININLGTSGTITLNDKAKSEFQRVLEIPSSGDSIPLTISNQMATYDATTLNSVKWDFGNNTYSIFGTDETSFTTKTRTSGNLEKTADVIIGTAGAYAIPDDLLHYFGLSMKEMGQIPIGFSVTSNGNNIGGLGIGGTTDALVLWGGKTVAGTGANCLSIQPSGISLIGQSMSGPASVNIAGGGIVFNAPNSLNFNLGNSGTLSMSAKMISELKRLLGIS